jgi:hypothetical protein
MKHWYIICFTVSIFAVSNAQTQLTTMGVLPREIGESSGLEIGQGDTYWTHNDKGDQPWLFLLSSEGKLLRKVFIKNVTAKDLEDLTIEEDKFMYVGDFGNNKNDRQDLRIYKIRLEWLYQQDTVIPETIHFSYEDQRIFPPKKADRNFDCEAFFWYRGQLYLFTKNRGDSGYTKCYGMNTTQEKQVARLIDSFMTGNWVTSADISPLGNKMALLCGPVLYVFTDFKQDKFFKGKHFKTVMAATQKEAAVFKSEEKLVMTDERNNMQEGLLYSLSIKDERVFSIHQERFVISPFPVNKELLIVYTMADTTQYVMEIKHLDNNRTVLKETINAYKNYFTKLSLAGWEDGKYQITFSHQKERYFLKQLFNVQREN